MVWEFAREVSSETAMPKNKTSQVVLRIKTFKDMDSPYTSERDIFAVKDSRSRFLVLLKLSLVYRLVYNFFRYRVPIKSFSGPIRLRRHNGDNRVREAMIHVGIWHLAGLH
jgi:hypothetical protein